MPSHCPLQLLHADLLLCPWLTAVTTFPKLNLLVSNSSRLTRKFKRGQQQPKQSLKFVFWSTQWLLFVAIRHEQMHLWRKTRLAVSGEAGQLLWLMGCLHLLWIHHASNHAQCNISSAEWVFLAHILLWQRPLKEHNGRCESSIPLATNHVYFAIIYWLFSRANRKIADWFSMFQPSNIFHSFLCAIKMGWQRFDARSRQAINHGEKHDASDFDTFTLFNTRDLFEKWPSVRSRTLKSDIWCVALGTGTKTIWW